MGRASIAVYAVAVRSPPLILGVLLASLLHAQKAPQGTVVSDPAGVRLDRVVQERAPLFWGAVLVAAQGEVVLAKGYGLADRRKVPLGPQSLFDLGGASQQLTTLAVLSLLAEHKLQLGDPLQKYLPEWPADRAAITIEHLLRHTSGLPPEATWSGNAASTGKAALAAIGRTRLVDKPGAAVHYSALHGVLLAMVVETLAPPKFERALTDRVLKPFGMTTAGPSNGRFDSRLLTARRSMANERGELPTVLPFTWAQRGASAVLASPLDVHALLGGLCAGKILDRRHLDVLWRPVAGDTLQISRQTVGPDVLVRVAGQAGGYRTRWLIHEASRSWVVLCTDDLTITEALEGALLAEVAQQRLTAAAAATAPPAGAHPPTAPGTPTAPPAAADRDRFVGVFVLPGTGGRLVIERAGAELVIRGEGLQAAARLLDGEWPPANATAYARTEDRGLSVLERVLRGDATVAGEAFPNASVAASAAALLTAWAAKSGPLVRVEFLGTRVVDRAFHSWFRLVGQRGSQVVRSGWLAAERLTGLVTSDEPLPFRADLAVVRPDVAVAKTASGVELRFTMEGPPGRRVLVLEDASVGPAGLIDCLEVSGAPR